jgi:hypothetical protein
MNPAQCSCVLKFNPYKLLTSKSLLAMKTKMSLITFALLCGCTPVKQSVTRQPDHNGSIETVISVKHFPTYDLLVTTHTVWVNQAAVKRFATTDTVPSLGNTTRTIESEFDAPETKIVPRNYQLFITVK